MKKVTVKASSDVALIKYWGKKDEILRLPENGSLSLVLEGLDTVTSVEFFTDGRESMVTINGDHDNGEEGRVLKHIDRIRNMAVARGVISERESESMSVAVLSQNTFPRATGLSSSASGFAALTVAATRALGLDLTQQEMSILARQGSGSACRCIVGGVAEWLNGDTSESSYAVQLYAPEYWDLRDVVVVVDEGRKDISTTEGHQTAQSSPFFQVRLDGIDKKITSVKAALEQKNFQQLGEIVEAETLEFHSILLTSQPALIAWYPGTIEVMRAVRKLRSEGVLAYFTINTGFNVHVLTLPEYEDRVAEKMKSLSLTKQVLHARIGGAPQIVSET